MAGEIPPAGRTRPGRRRRARDLHQLRLVVGARPRADAAPGRDRNTSPAAAVPALAAAAPARYLARRAKAADGPGPSTLGSACRGFRAGGTGRASHGGSTEGVR